MPEEKSSSIVWGIRRLFIKEIDEDDLLGRLFDPQIN
jgi:hypothetical protein